MGNTLSLPSTFRPQLTTFSTTGLATRLSRPPTLLTGLPQDAAGWSPETGFSLGQPQLSPSAELVGQMHEAFLSYLHGPEVAPLHLALMTGDVVSLEWSQRQRREEVEPRDFLWGEWGDKLLRFLAPVFPGAQLKRESIAVAKELEHIERRALLSFAEARKQHYQDQFAAWRKAEIVRQELIMIKGVLLQLMQDVRVLVNGMVQDEEARESLGSLLIEEFVIPRLLTVLQQTDEEETEANV